MKLDMKKLTEARIKIEATIRDLKEKRRESHQPRWTYRSDYDLAKAKNEATQLYAMIAHTRRHIHAPKLLELPEGVEATRELLLEAQLGFIAYSIPAFQRTEAPTDQIAISA